jgi:hypothetical protein
VRLHGIFKPRPSALAAFKAFAPQFSRLEAEIQQALWPEYIAYRQAVDDGHIPAGESVIVSSPSDLWHHTKLIQIEIGPYRDPEALELGFGVDWDIDHTKGVGIARGKVTYVNGSIRAWA